MKFRWDKKYLYAGVTAFAVIVASLVLIWIVSSWDGIWASFRTVTGILSPVLYGLVIAYLLSPVCNFVERTCFSKLGKKCFSDKPYRARALSRGLSVTVSVLFALILFAVLLYMVLPQVFQSVQTVVQRAVGTGGYVEAVTQWADNLFHGQGLEDDLSRLLRDAYQSGIDWLQKTLLPQMDSLLVGVSMGVVSVFKTFFNWVMGVVIAIYLLYNKELFLAQSKKMLYSLLPARPVNRLLKNAALTHKMFGGFFTAKLLDSAVVGVLCYVFMLIFRIPYAELVSVLVAVTNIIPFFGPFIGAIPSALLILLEDPWKCLVFLIGLLALQQLDANLIGPRLMGNTTGLNSFWVMVALLLGGGFFGFFGMVCGVPVFAVLYTLIRTGCEGRLKKRQLPVSTTDYRRLQSIDEETHEPVYRAEPVKKEPRLQTTGKKKKAADVEKEKEG